MTQTKQDKFRQLRQLVRTSRARLKRLEQERAALEQSLQQVDEGLNALASQDGGALMRAVGGGDAHAVRSEIESGADPDVRNQDGEPVLLLACSTEGGLPVVRELLRGGATVDRADPAGTTALIACATDENLAVVKELVRHGADVNARNRDGDSPLTNAACWGAEQVVRFLLARGADPNARDGLGVTAAELARQQGHDRIAAILRRRSKRAG